MSMEEKWSQRAQSRLCETTASWILSAHFRVDPQRIDQSFKFFL